MDQQIKVRGVRIEPQGVEAALDSQPEVAESLVRCVEDPDGKKHLVAYLAVSQQGADVHESALPRRLRTHLERTFPRFMVPDWFLFLDRLPRTSRGKLDVAALPVPDFGRAHPKPSFVAPRNEVEEALAQIWKRVLHLERIGVHDDFVHCGGDSLSATRMVAQVNRAFGVALSLRDFFDDPTIASLAVLVSEHISSGA